MRTLFLLAGKNGAESGQYWTLFYSRIACQNFRHKKAGFTRPIEFHLIFYSSL